VLPNFSEIGKLDMSVEALAKAPEARFVRLLQGELQTERRALIKFLGLSLCGALLALVPPDLSRRALDQALPDHAPRLLVVLSAAALLVGLHRAWAGWLEDTARNQLGAQVEGRALVSLMRAVLKADASWLSRRGSGWTSETLGGASELIAGYVGAIAGLLTQGCMTVAYLAVMVPASPGGTFVVVLMSAAIVGVSAAFLPTELRVRRAVLEQSGIERQHLQGLLAALPALRGLFSVQKQLLRWDESLARATRTDVERSRVGASRSLVLNAGTRLLGLGALAWAALRCLNSNGGIGELVFATSMAAGLSSSLTGLGGAVLGLRALAPQLERVDELLGNAPQDADEATAFEPTEDRIVFENVSFRYSETTPWVVHQRSLELQRGQVTHLQSPSGSGKSTLLRLLAGHLVPTGGRIRVFGVDAQQARSQVLYLPQHCTLFEASIGENLRVLSGAGDDAIARAADLTGLSLLLEQLPMGLGTPVAAQGQNLSSGQRQLIAITAAFASSRPVLLLDEATSQIDHETRARMQWGELLAGRTVVSVDHDLPTS
jgi:ABC-type bacteriocin/lantibiotic exporter with double-glycine peptidase domain